MPRTRRRSHRHPSSARHVHGAQYKAGRPGGPPRSPSGSEAPRDRPASAEEGRTAAPRRRWRQPEGLRRDAPGAPPGPLPGATGSAHHATASSGAEASAASSPPSGRPPPGPSPIGGLSTPGGAGAGSPDGAPRRAAPRHAEAAPKTSRSWLGALAAGIVGGAIAALAELLGTVSRRRSGGRLARPGSGYGAGAGRGRRPKRRCRATDHAGRCARERLGRRRATTRARSKGLGCECGPAKRLDALEPGGRAQVQDLATRVDQLEVAVAAAGGSGARP